MKEKIKVIVKEPFKGFEVREIPKGDESFKKLIGGDIFVENYDLPGNLLIVVKDNAKREAPPNLKLNSLLIDDILCGTAVFTYDDNDGEGEEFIGLPDEKIEDVLMMLPILFQSLTEEEAQKINPEDYIVNVVPSIIRV